MDEENKEEKKEEKAPEKESKKKSSTKKASKPKRKAVVLPIRRTISFEKWASQRNIKPRHKPGMLAFVENPNTPRTMEEWDSLFEDY